MTRKPLRPVVVAIVGATATGKTKLALEAAKRVSCEVINLDSVQVYKGLDIGTAKPTRQELSQVKHHLIDYMDPPQTLNAADYRRQAIKILEDCERRQVPLVFLVGGTGFYLQALIKGMHPVQSPPEEIKKSVLDDLSAEGLPYLYEELKKLDPQYAAKLHATDTYRISRGVEIIRSTGKTVTQVRSEFSEEPLRWRFFSIGLKRRKTVLRSLVEERTEFMIENGLLEEVQKHRAMGLGDWGPLKSVGYKEAGDFLDKKISREEMLSQIVHNTMQLAKRQGTWFRRDRNTIWFDVDHSPLAPLELISEYAVAAGVKPV